MFSDGTDLSIEGVQNSGRKTRSKGEIASGLLQDCYSHLEGSSE